MPARFVLRKTGKRQWMFNLHAANKEIILTSQQYQNRTGAVNGIESVQINAADDEQFERRRSKPGQVYFVLKAVNGKVIGRSEQYTSKASLEKGIKAVATNAPGAGVEERIEELS